jgi:cell division septum initiation protein DivIVA
MTDHRSVRVDEILTELIELVETARSLPMSTSCVVPRERTLDLLDALRDVLPPEMEEARALVAQREDLLAAAQARAAELEQAALAASESAVAAASSRASDLLRQATAEQVELVSATSVQQRAERQAADLRASAEEYAAATRAHADDYAARLRADSHRYADQTLSELIAHLRRLAATAENGREALTGDGGIS